MQHEHQDTHTHSHPNDLNQQAASRLALSLGLTLAFLVIEFIAGLWANSLALLTDAVHNLTDVLALGLSWYAMRLTLQPPNANKTFGYHRAGILAAFINSSTLVVISLGIFYEAYQRLISPPEVKSGVLIGVGLLAFIINLGTAWLVKQGSEHDLNLRSAFVHLMGDVFSTIGAVIAGIIIWFTGWNLLDPLVSALIGFLILWNAWIILRETADILLESTPLDIDMQLMVKDIMQVPHVLGVHDLHVWSITRSLRALSAHILTDDLSLRQGAEIQRQVNELVSRNYQIGHATLQLECEGCEPNGLFCDLNGKSKFDEA